jgi:hypothetical protein
MLFRMRLKDSLGPSRASRGVGKFDIYMVRSKDASGYRTYLGALITDALSISDTTALHEGVLAEERGHHVSSNVRLRTLVSVERGGFQVGVTAFQWPQGTRKENTYSLTYNSRSRASTTALQKLAARKKECAQC